MLCYPAAAPADVVVEDVVGASVVVLVVGLAVVEDVVGALVVVLVVGLAVVEAVAYTSSLAGRLGSGSKSHQLKVKTTLME